MPNLYTSDKKTVGELLSSTSPRIVVPEFQRNFSWTTVQVETFWQDLLDFSEQVGPGIGSAEYFLGAVVLVRAEGENILLDGQQRLATATILLSVLRDFLNENGNDNAATRIQQKYISDLDDLTGGSQYNLTLNEYDRSFFRATIQDRGATQPEPRLESHELIKRARAYFQEQVGRKVAEIGAGGPMIQWVHRVRKILTDHLSVVVVSSEDEDNASTVFETLNDRGIGLSAPDLLRNFLLKRAIPAQRAEIVECWREILSIEDEARVEDFLRHYWLSLRGDVKTRSLYREIKSTLHAAGTDPLTFSRELRDVAAVYRDIVLGRDEDAECKDLLQEVKELGSKNLIPAILSAHAAGGIEPRRRFLRVLVATYVRYSVIGGREGSKFETIVYGAARRLREDRDFSRAERELRQIATDDTQFRSDFSTAQIQKSAAARYVLRKLEKARWSTEEISVSADTQRVSLEHIYPENPAGARLPNHEAWVDRVGNLTLLARPLNRELRNAEFERKKAVYARSEIRITKTLAGEPDWGADTIRARQATFATAALSIWALP